MKSGFYYTKLKQKNQLRYKKYYLNTFVLIKLPKWAMPAIIAVVVVIGLLVLTVGRYLRKQAALQKRQGETDDKIEPLLDEEGFDAKVREASERLKRADQKEKQRGLPPSPPKDKVFLGIEEKLGSEACTEESAMAPKDGIQVEQCKWACYLSHHQAAATFMVQTLKEKIERMLEREGQKLKKAWIDKEQAANENGMHEGVKHSQFFLLFMTKEVLHREWCLKELRWALKYRKPIIIVYCHEARHGGSPGSFSDYYLGEIKRTCPNKTDEDWVMKNTYVQFHDRGTHAELVLRDPKSGAGILDQMDKLQPGHD